MTASQRATAEAERLLKQAERDAETLRKEAALEAREKAHELTAGAEQQARDRRQEIIALEQALADKTRALADRLGTTDRLEQDLRARETALAAQEADERRLRRARASSCWPSASASCSASPASPPTRRASCC